MRRGQSVTVTLEDGTRVKGQVWEEAEPEGAVWVALDNGTYAKALDGMALNESGAQIGRVA